MTVTLKCSYGTSGNSNTGVITYLDPFTIVSGFTFSLQWQQRNANAQITSSGKDAYVYANGEVIEYLLFKV